MKKTLFSAAVAAGTVVAGTGHASAEEVAPAPVPSPPAPYTVVRGDDLWSIATARLGASERWLEIYALNQDTLRNPDQIEVGQVLEIPTSPVGVPPNLLAGGAAPAAPDRARAVAQRPTATRSTAVRRVSATSGLAGIRRCESGGNYQAVSAGGTYRGAYQFDRRTWASVGGSGDPAAASPAEQDGRAQQLRSQRGSNPWPNCG